MHAKCCCQGNVTPLLLQTRLPWLDVLSWWSVSIKNSSQQIFLLKKNAFRCICFCDVEIPCQKRKERKLGRIDKREHCCSLVKLFPDFFSVCVWLHACSRERERACKGDDGLEETSLPTDFMPQKKTTETPTRKPPESSSNPNNTTRLQSKAVHG